MRKSIFDIVASKLDMEGDTYRLLIMSREEKTLFEGRSSSYSLFEFVDKYCFKYWKYRSRYINMDDFLRALDFDSLVKAALTDIDSHLTLIELIYNFWNLANSKFDEREFSDLRWHGNFNHIKAVMDEILEEYNHIVYTSTENDYFIVVENKAAVTSAAEIAPTEDLSFDIIRYNHRSLKGNIAAKKAILVALGNELEPKRKTLQIENTQLADNIFFMLNNLNLRHNNCSESDPAKYKRFVAEMESSKLEEWYDELYQMILLSFLLLDNTERSIKVKELKAKVISSPN